jgi:hypothetical protein
MTTTPALLQQLVPGYQRDLRATAAQTHLVTKSGTNRPATARKSSR